MLLAGVWAALSAQSASGDVSRRAALVERRDRLMADLVRAEEQRRAGTLDERRYAARHEELVTQLERVYGELDSAAGRHRRGLAAVECDFDRLVVDDVSRHFGRRRALTRVSLTCGAGTILGLLGPNGAGKSTLLAILSTLLAPTSGQVHYGTFDARSAGPRLRARLGLLGHDLYLYPELTARENLEFFARLYGLDHPRERVVRALAHAGLADRADDAVSGFSRGMRQRLALERALLHGPRLLLLDEPFTGLDDASGHALVSRLRGLRDEGAIVIAATHDLDLADGLLDEVAILREGRLLAVPRASGPLRERYRETIVAATSTAAAPAGREERAR